MNPEKYELLSKCQQPLRPLGAAMVLDFSKTAAPGKQYRLFVTGETGLFYQWKDEPDYQFQYRTLSDCLDTAHARQSHYCLNLSVKTPVDYVRRAYAPTSFRLTGCWPIPTRGCPCSASMIWVVAP